MRRYTRILSSIFALSSFVATAHAHGGIVRALSIEFNPTNPDHVVVASSVFGQFTSVTGGESWTVTCYKAQGGADYSMNESVPLLISSNATTFTQPGWSTVQGTGQCAWEEAPLSGTSGAHGAGVKRAADGALITMTSIGGETTDGGSSGLTELFHSDPTGASFSRFGTPLEGSFIGDSFVLSPSSPKRVFLSGFLLDAAAVMDRHAMARSDDSGTTWTVSPSPLISTTDYMANRQLLAVDPSNPDLLFARESVAIDGVSWQHTIVFSRDAGATWRTLHEGVKEVSGFAFSPDGGTIALGDAADGLFHVDVASLTTGNAPTITRMFFYPVWGIAWNERGLYAGLDQFGPIGQPQFPTVGVSHDGGRSFDPFLDICSVEAASCPSAPDATGCFPDFVRDFKVLSRRCPTSNPPGVGGGTGGSSAEGGSGGAASAGGDSASSGGTSSSGGAGGARPQPEELRVTSCGMSSMRADPDAKRFGFLMLVAALVGAASRKSRKRESRNQYV